MKTIIDKLYSQIRNNSEGIAISCEGRNYSYSEMGMILDKISSDLKNTKLSNARNIAILAKRSELNVLLSLAILNIGCTFIPLDENLPKERLILICKKANVRLIVGDTSTIQEKLQSAIHEFEVIYYSVEDLKTKNFSNSKISLDPNVIDVESPAVIVFTSGSTGEPKGVIHSHKCLYVCNSIDAQNHSLTKEDNILSVLNFCYAFSLQVYQPFMVGATLHIATDKIRKDLYLMNQYIVKNSISVATMPTQMGFIFCSTQTCSTLRLLIVGGGVFPQLQKYPDYQVKSNYGCTECIFAAYQEISHNSDHSNLGKPSKYLTFKVIDKNGNETKENEAGELWIAGPTVAIEYLDLPEQNKQKFVTVNGIKWCRTGDEVVQTSTGDYKYLGRLDGMIKLRNQRIETTEIEYWISGISGVKQVCVCVKEIANTSHLCAYYVSNNGASISMEESLKKHLPDYMVPSFFILVNSLPTNSNGKIDKNALPAPSINTNGSISPRTKNEKLLVHCISSVLSMKEEIYLDDNFKNLGGDSLDALRLSAMLRDKGMIISMKDILVSTDLVTLLSKVETLQEVEDNSNQQISEGHCSCPAVIGHMIEHNTKKAINGFVIPEFFRCKTRTTGAVVKKTISKLLEHHPILRANIVDGKYYINATSNTNNYYFEERNIDIIPEKKDNNINQIVVYLYSCIDVFSGPSLAVILLHCPDTDYILTACSHLVSDNFSKEIFKRDFITVFSQITEHKKIQLPIKTNSYLQYSNIVNVCIPNKYNGLKTDYCKEQYRFEHMSVLIDENCVTNYSQSVWGKSGKGINIYIISCIIYVLKKTLCIETHNFLVYRHGRDLTNEFSNSFSFDQTIGFFSMCYCVNINVQNRIEDIFNQIDLSLAKNKKIDYYSQHDVHKNKPIFGFDYLGEIREYKDFSNRYLESAGNISKGHYTPVELSMGVPITAFMMKKNGSLIIQFRYNSNNFKLEDFESFVFEFSKVVKECVAFQPQ